MIELETICGLIATRKAASHPAWLNSTFSGIYREAVLLRKPPTPTRRPMDSFRTAGPHKVQIYLQSGTVAHRRRCSLPRQKVTESNCDLRADLYHAAGGYLEIVRRIVGAAR
jgi:hypothetical protein